MDLSNYVHIVQDAALLIRYDSHKKGVLTEGVESCLLIIAEGGESCAFVHDSGQLNIADIAALIRRVENLRKLTFVLGIQAFSLHRDRVKKLIGMLGVAGRRINRSKINSPSFDFAWGFDGAHFDVPAGGFSNKGVRDPNLAMRSAINRLNIFFLDKNAQNLSLDLQYEWSAFSPIPLLGLTLNEMLRKVSIEKKFIDLNLHMLYEGHVAGVIRIPDELLGIVRKYGLEKPRRLIDPSGLIEEYMNWFVR